MRFGLLVLLAFLRLRANAHAYPAMEARTSLTGALDTIQTRTMGRDPTAWRPLRDRALYFAERAHTPREASGAVFRALLRAHRRNFPNAAAAWLRAQPVCGSVR